MINGKTKLIAHLGYPTESFKAPMIYNPYFEQAGIDAVVMPMGCTAEDYPPSCALLFRLDQHPRRAGHHAAQGDDRRAASTRSRRRRRSPGACNAVRRARTAGSSATCSTARASCAASCARGAALEGARALVVGSGGVGSAIAASLAEAGVGELAALRRTRA